MKIEKPGIFEIGAGAYHADPCPEPSLSSHVAHVLLSESPLHAKTAHPRLNPDLIREEKDIFDRGAAAHAFLLEGESAFALIDAEDWRTKAAKEEREAARLAGKIPLLRYRWREIQEMVDAINLQLDAYTGGPRPFTAGKPESTIAWQDEGAWCRARLDWLHDDHAWIDDFKSTGASAHPAAWPRTAYGMGADVQMAFYLRALKAVTGSNATFRFVVVENYPPYALSVISLEPGALAVAERKVQRAIEIWEECLRTDRWPGYPTRTCYAEIPAYEETAWIAREEREMQEVA